MVFDLVEICKEFVRRIVVCLIKLRDVRSLLRNCKLID